MLDLDYLNKRLPQPTCIQFSTCMHGSQLSTIPPTHHCLINYCSLLALDYKNILCSYDTLYTCGNPNGVTHNDYNYIKALRVTVFSLALILLSLEEVIWGVLLSECLMSTCRSHYVG